MVREEDTLALDELGDGDGGSWIDRIDQELEAQKSAAPASMADFDFESDVDDSGLSSGLDGASANHSGDADLDFGAEEEGFDDLDSVDQLQDLELNGAANEGQQSDLQGEQPKPSKKKLPVGLIAAAGAAIVVFGVAATSLVSKFSPRAPAAAEQASQVAVEPQDAGAQDSSAQAPSDVAVDQAVASPALQGEAPQAEAPSASHANNQNASSETQMPASVMAEQPSADAISQARGPSYSPTAAAPSQNDVEGLRQVVALQQQALQDLEQKSADMSLRLAASEQRFSDYLAQQESERKAAMMRNRVRMKGFQFINSSADGKMAIVKISDGTTRAFSVGDTLTYQGKRLTVSSLDAERHLVEFGDVYYADETLEVAVVAKKPAATKPAAHEPADEQPNPALAEAPKDTKVTYAGGEASTQRSTAPGWSMNAIFDGDKYLLQDSKGKFIPVRKGQTLPGLGLVEGLDPDGALRVGPYLIKATK